MLTREDAERLVAERIAGACGELSDGDELVVLEDRTIERPWGWVVFYTSKLWLETKEFRYALAGNAPYLVERSTGRAVVLGTALPVEDYIAAYERTGNPHAR